MVAYVLVGSSTNPVFTYPFDASRNSGRGLLKAASEIREMGSMAHVFTWLRRQHRPNECEIELCVGEPLSCRTP
jgi:hypothetical protein